MESCPLSPLSNELVASVHTLPLDVNGLYSQHRHCVETLIAEIPLNNGPLFLRHHVPFPFENAAVSDEMRPQTAVTHTALSSIGFCAPVCTFCGFSSSRHAVGDKAKQI